MKDPVQSLGAVTDRWLDPKNPLREETVQALQVSTGLSHRQIELAIANCFEELTAPKITAFLHDWGQSPTSDISRVLHILPSNAFTAWVPGAAITLLFGLRCLLKPSRREPVFAAAWKESLQQVDPQLAERVDLIVLADPWLQESEVVVAYGSDETLVKVRAMIPDTARFAGYGHKLSVGIIFAEAFEKGFSDELLDRVRQDAEPFRLQGCLSPQILYVENPACRQAGAPPLRWPELEAAVDVAPKIKPFTEWENLKLELSKFSPYLSCVGYAGRFEKEQFLEKELRDLKISRVCPLGRMQRPPLAWRNGGIFLPDLLNSSRERFRAHSSIG